MGWGLRILAFVGAVLFFALGVWPISIAAFGYIALSFRKPKKEVYVLKQQHVAQQPGRPWGRYIVGGSLLILSFFALRSGGTLSPIILASAGWTVLLWPAIRTSKLINRVRPIENSVLLRYSSLPFMWCAFAEVKLESENPTRAVSSLDGEIILFAGKNPSALLGVSAIAFSYRGAERRVLARLRRASRHLSKRGGYLLPLDSAVAAATLSASLERVDLEPGDIEAASTLPFDVFVMHVEKARVVSHGAFTILDDSPGTASVPCPNQHPVKQPLLWELVEMIGEKHGWPGPDMYSSFLSALHATRGEAIGERLAGLEISGEKRLIQSVDGTKVELSRPQLRALAEIYA